MKGCGLFRPSGLHCTWSLGVCISWFGQSIIMVPTRPSQASLVLCAPHPPTLPVFSVHCPHLLPDFGVWDGWVIFMSPYLTVAWGRLWEAITPFLLCTSHTWEPCACLPNLEEARRWAVFFSISSKTRRLDQVFYRVQPFCPIYLLPPKQPHALHCAHQHTGVKPAWKYSLNQRCLWTQENTCTHLCHAGA